MSNRCGIVVGRSELGKSQEVMKKNLESNFKVEFPGIVDSGKKITSEEIKKSIEFIGYKSEDI